MYAIVQANNIALAFLRVFLHMVSQEEYQMVQGEKSVKEKNMLSSH